MIKSVMRCVGIVGVICGMNMQGFERILVRPISLSPTKHDVVIAGVAVAVGTAAVMGIKQLMRMQERRARTKRESLSKPTDLNDGSRHEVSDIGPSLPRLGSKGSNVVVVLPGALPALDSTDVQVVHADCSSFAGAYPVPAPIIVGLADNMPNRSQTLPRNLAPLAAVVMHARSESVRTQLNGLNN